MVQTAIGQEVRSIELSVLEDRVRGGMAGQMVGVGYGGPTEFAARAEIYEHDIEWEPSMIGDALAQDDLYVEMTFTEVMDKHGLDAPIERYGEAFKDTKYLLFHANAAARRWLNQGIKPPMTGHPKYNLHALDIDFQIEADFIGLMTPGMPQTAIQLCDKIGRVMNYGDGVYGGMFVAGMYAEAYFETDVEKVVKAGVACMPRGSKYRGVIEDVIAFHAAVPDDWRACWKFVYEKYEYQDPCPEGSLTDFNIDASINGAYIAVGLLYGDGDFSRTMEIATRCGQDSDCNPANAAGILGAMYGLSQLDERWVGRLDEFANKKFVHTNYSFNSFIDSTMNRIQEAAKRAGGDVREGKVLIPVQNPEPPELEVYPFGVPRESLKYDHPAWTWTGDWDEVERERYAAPAAMVSHGGGNEVTLEFVGSGVSLVGYCTTNGGMAEVSVDGKKFGIINAYIGPGTFEQDLWHVLGLEDGPHTVRIVTLDEADPRSIDHCEPSLGMGRADDGQKRFEIHRAVVFRPE
jgi:hypothetical protein